MKYYTVIYILFLLILPGCEYLPYANFRIPQNGMFPNLPKGSGLIAKMHPYKSVEDIVRGDVVLFNVYRNKEKYIYIWRAVGLPGDSIVVNDGKLWIQGENISYKRLNEETNYTVIEERLHDSLSYNIIFLKEPKDTPPGIAMKIPANSIFVLGDNRYGAVDSRYLGPIKFDDIIGVVKFRYL